MTQTTYYSHPIWSNINSTQYGAIKWDGWWQKKSKTTYKPCVKFIQRPFDDDSDVPIWPTGSESQKIFSWPSFLTYWKKNYPHINVRKKGADTCTDCLVLTNEFRFQKGTTTAGSTYDSAGEDDVDIENKIDTVEVIIFKAKSHVQMYQIQRKW